MQVSIEHAINKVRDQIKATEDPKARRILQAGQPSLPRACTKSCQQKFTYQYVFVSRVMCNVSRAARASTSLEGPAARAVGDPMFALSAG